MCPRLEIIDRTGSLRSQCDNLVEPRHDVLLVGIVKGLHACIARIRIVIGNQLIGAVGHADHCSCRTDHLNGSDVIGGQKVRIGAVRVLVEVSHGARGPQANDAKRNDNGQDLRLDGYIRQN